MTDTEIKALSGQIAKALKPMVLDILAHNALSVVKPEMDRAVTRRELWAMLGSVPNQPNGGKPEFL